MYVIVTDMLGDRMYLAWQPLIYDYGYFWTEVGNTLSIGQKAYFLLRNWQSNILRKNKLVMKQFARTTGSKNMK